MSILDWSFVALLSAALLFVLFALLCFFMALSTGRKVKRFKRKPPKNKQKRKRFLVKRRSLEKQKKRQRTLGLLFMLGMLATGGGAVYSRYYQMTNLEASDSEAIVQSYYLTGEIEQQLTNIKNGENPEKSINTLRDVSSRLASYGIKRPYEGLTEEGQKILTRYYATIKSLGTNLANQTIASLEKNEIVESYFKDIEKVKAGQKKVFKVFSVNESALKQKK